MHNGDCWSLRSWAILYCKNVSTQLIRKTAKFTAVRYKYCQPNQSRNLGKKLFHMIFAAHLYLLQLLFCTILFCLSLHHFVLFKFAPLSKTYCCEYIVITLFVWKYVPLHQFIQIICWLCIPCVPKKYRCLINNGTNVFCSIIRISSILNRAYPDSDIEIRTVEIHWKLNVIHYFLYAIFENNVFKRYGFF